MKTIARESNIDIIRVLSVFIIVNFHFCAALGRIESPFYRYANGGWGSVGTTMFYLMSGYVMMLNYPKVEHIKAYYQKRALSLYPTFYIVFLAGYLYHSIDMKNFQYGGAPWRFLYSILGIDGYMTMNGIQTYYIIGEWFTGVIIICYLLYPILNLLIQKYQLATTLILFLFYFSNICFHFSKTVPDAAICTGLFLFWLGMLMQTHSNHIKQTKILLPICILCIISIVSIKLPFFELPYKNLLGISIFTILYILCNQRTLPVNIEKYVQYICKISYPIYLCHHIIINILAAENVHRVHSTQDVLLLLIAAYTLILLFSSLVYYFEKGVMKALKKLPQKLK